MKRMNFEESVFMYNDGGRFAAGFKGFANDCVCRSIAIATQIPYRDVYDIINDVAKSERAGKRKRGKSSARNGVYKATIRKIMAHMGWEWVPTMFVGQGCKVHLCKGELPNGRIIVNLSEHLTAMINGDVHDTGDPRRIWTAPYKGQKLKTNQWIKDEILYTETRCVYGYWIN